MALNRCIFLGRLTKDPELRYTQSAEPQAVAKFSIAVDRNYTKADGTRETDFFDIVGWRKTAEFIEKYFKKGMRVAVEGRMQQRKWEDNEGKTRYAYEVVADNVDFADGKKDNETNGDTEIMPPGFDPITDSIEGDDLPF